MSTQPERPTLRAGWQRLLGRKGAEAADGQDGADDVRHAPLGVAVREIATTDVLWADPEEPVSTIAQRMAAAGAGSVLVRPGPGGCADGDGVDGVGAAGIVTDRDLRNRVLARGLGADTPVGEIASRPLLTLDADAPVAAAHLRMLEAGVRHLALVDGEDTVVGIVSSTDLHRHHSQGPFFVLHRLDHDVQTADLEIGGYAAHRHRAVASLRRAGVGALRIAEVASHLDDHLVRKVLERSADELGAPPVPWAWVAFGADGRREQAIARGQHNALIYDDPEGSPELAESMHRLAERATTRLAQAGLPEGPDGFVAGRWCMTFEKWRRRFRHWLDEPDLESVEHAVVFFDLRVVAGDLDEARADPRALSAEALSGLVAEAATKPAFLAALADTARRRKPPLGLFRRFKTADDGTLDLVDGGIRPIVALARVLGLAAAGGRPPTQTRDRLRQAASSGLLDDATAQRLMAIHEGLMDQALDLALEPALDQAAGDDGSPSPPRAVRPSDLDAGGKRGLRDDLTEIRRQQRLLDRRLDALPRSKARTRR